MRLPSPSSHWQPPLAVRLQIRLPEAPPPAAEPPAEFLPVHQNPHPLPEAVLGYFFDSRFYSLLFGRNCHLIVCILLPRHLQLCILHSGIRHLLLLGFPVSTAPCPSGFIPSARADTVMLKTSAAVSAAVPIRFNMCSLLISIFLYFTPFPFTFQYLSAKHKNKSRSLLFGRGFLILKLFIKISIKPTYIAEKYDNDRPEAPEYDNAKETSDQHRRECQQQYCESRILHCFCAIIELLSSRFFLRSSCSAFSSRSNFLPCSSLTAEPAISAAQVRHRHRLQNRVYASPVMRSPINIPNTINMTPNTMISAHIF